MTETVTTTKNTKTIQVYDRKSHHHQEHKTTQINEKYIHYNLEYKTSLQKGQEKTNIQYKMFYIGIYSSCAVTVLSNIHLILQQVVHKYTHLKMHLITKQ